MGSFQAPITIYQAIEKIQKNEYLLPSFQREFQWGSDRIEQLFDSIMLGYPISSMLFWKVKGDARTEFKFYKFLDKYIEIRKTHNEIMSTSGLSDFHAVLDGQQRLTSLFIGLCGSYAYHEYRKSWAYSEWTYPTRHLYLNISTLLSEEENDRRYNFSFLNKANTKEQELYIDSNKEKWFRVGIILKLHNNFGIDDFAEKHKLTKESKRILLTLDKAIFTDRNINFYEEEDAAPDIAVNIFVRINAGGMSLSFSDILMSIATVSWKKENAREEIYNLPDTVNSFGFSINKDFILKAFLYLYHKDVRFRVVSFNNKFIEKIENDWANIRNSIISHFELLKTFGLTNHSLPSYYATLPILYYIYHKNVYKGFSTKIEYKKDREIIKKWLLTMIVRRSFGSSADTVLSQSRRAFTTDIEKEKIKSLEFFPAKEINKEIRKITEVGEDYIQELLSTQKDNRYCFSILSLLYPDMDYKNNNFNKDHMHPAAAYEKLPKKAKEELGWESYNSILNLQMLDENENKSKQDKSLKEWVDNETKKTDEKRFRENHLIPINIDLSLSNFNEFIEKRKELLVEKLQKILN
jgi:uncharacterized protein with ParB-like and HNH nuclease domain